MINGILMQATGTLNAANEQIRATSSRFSRHRHSLMSPLLACFATAILGNYANSFTFRRQNFPSSSFEQRERERKIFKRDKLQPAREIFLIKAYRELRIARQAKADRARRANGEHAAARDDPASTKESVKRSPAIRSNSIGKI